MASTRWILGQRGALRSGVILGVLAIGVSAAAISACVGDDPSSPTSNDDGGTDAGGDAITTGDSNTTGDGATPDGSTSPTVVEVAAGMRASCAVLSDGTLWCWGGDDLGQLGVASASLTAVPSCEGPCSPTPVQIHFPAGVQIAHVAAHGQICAISSTGDLYCWGDNSSDQLGHAQNSDGDVPCAPSNQTCNITPQKVDGIADVAKVVVGSAVTCALTTGHSVYCWGANYTLALGDPTDNTPGTNTATPKLLSTFAGKTIVDIAIAQNAPQACAAALGEGIYCWGYNDNAQLGHASGAGSPADTAVGGGVHANSTPEIVANTPNATHVAVSQWTSCGSTDGGTAGCWGGNFNGQFGSGAITTFATASTLSQAAGTQSDIATIVGGGGSDSTVFCTVATDSHLTCWGETGYGEVGNGMYFPMDAGSFDAGIQCNNDFCVDTPQALPMTVKQVSVGLTQTIALGTDGKVYAWGLNHYGQLGHAPATDIANCYSGSSGAVDVNVNPLGPCSPLPTIVNGLP